MKIKHVILSAILTLSAAMAHALDIQPYSSTALTQAQKADQAVAVHFHADWCSTCRAQTKVLQDLKSEKGLNLTVLVANYDAEKALKRSLNVNAQSTLIVFKGQKEVSRVVGDTSPDGIRRILKSAL